jgi:hypothetical protein
MKLFLLILGLVVVALNVFLWHSKKRGAAAKNKRASNKIDKSKGSQTNSAELLKGPEGDKLKEAAAAELGIPVEQLNHMSPDEIELLATEKDLI